MNTYAFCCRCHFGIETNTSHGSEIRAEFCEDTPEGLICYYCKFTKVRNVQQLERECETLLKTARRLQQQHAIDFYSQQLKRCQVKTKTKPDPQIELFV